jgi:replicative DNA helicase
MDYSNGLISCILNGGDMGDAIERGVTAQFFTEERDQRVFGSMLRHYQQHGTSPTPDVIAKSYPSYEIGVYPHPLGYYIDALASRRRQAIVINAAQEVVEALNTEGDDPGQDAVEVMEKAILQAHFETSPAKHVSYVDLLKRRVPEWMNGMTTPSIPYGIPTLDQHTGGMRPEQFVVVTGLAKSRKTWTVLHMASNVHVYGPVVFITFEMSNDEQLERLATLWGKIPYDLVRGDKSGLTDEHFQSMTRFLHVREQFSTFLGVEDAAGHSTVTSIQALIQETHPVLVVIDGVYFMTDEVTGQQGSSDHQALTNISRALKRLAKTQKVTVLATAQTLFGKTLKGKTNLFGMGYTSAFSQDADVVIGIEAMEDQPTLGVVRILGNRSGAQGIDFHLSWDLNTGLVEEVEGESGDAGGLEYDDID